MTAKRRKNQTDGTAFSELFESGFLLRLLENARDGIFVEDMSSRIEWANPAAETMFGWSLDEMRGMRTQSLVIPPENRPPEEASGTFRYDVQDSSFKGYKIVENMRRDGSRFWIQRSYVVVSKGSDGTDPRVLVTCRDVTEQVSIDNALQRVQVDLEHAAHHDALTGLANRKRLSDVLQSDALRRAIAARHVGVLEIDIDKFKEINDTLGHAAGDATLGHVANALRSNSTQTDLVCRTGGDEFLMICLDIGSEPALMARGETLREAIGAPLRWKDQTLRIGCSVGASYVLQDDTTGEDLIRNADQALYSAKNTGRGKVVLYTEGLGAAYRDRQRLARDLRLALTERQFLVHLQPQLRLSENQVSGCEALIRWQHPERGLLTPGAFLDAAETLGLLGDIDNISMNLALDALLDLRQSGFPDMCMSINVSSSILADQNYPGLLNWALQSRNLPAQAICVEILETTILDNVDLDVITAVEKLKRLGVRVALDDFGTGYAGLAHMSSFDIDAIKLDRSMIARLSTDPRNRVIIRSIIRLCGLLGVQVIAEGVETREQYEILRKAHCPLIQGFGLARPMPVADIITWLGGATGFSGEIGQSGAGKAPDSARSG